MGKSIGIIGAGTAGLHLGLYLRQHGVDATIITDKTADQVREMRLPNTVAHHHVTVAREKALGVDHWPAEEYGITGHQHHFGGKEPLDFPGYFSSQSRAVDYRIYLPTLMEDFEARGGTIEYRQIARDEIPALAKRFDLIAVGAGRGAFGDMFPRVAEYSPYDRPQRLISGGIYVGIRPTDPAMVTFSVSPGHGEIILIPMVSFSGRAHVLLFENIPGGDLEEVARIRYEDGRRHYLDTLLAKLEKHHPTIYERIDTERFDLQGPKDLIQGALVPAVRESSADLGDGKIAIAVGDAHSTVDPVIGQGANIASHAAWILGEEIVASDVFDKAFVDRVDERRMERVLGAQYWTNFMLAPPRPDFLALIGTMSQNQVLCDEFTENFNYPERQWARLKSPETVKAWIAERS